MNNQKVSAEQRFGSLVKAVRPGKLSQRELAARMVDLGHSGWLQSTVAKTEAGERPLRLNEFVGLCIALEQDPTEVLAPLVDDVPNSEMQRFTELRLALEYTRKNAERLAAEGEAALVEMRAASKALDEFMAAK